MSLASAVGYGTAIDYMVESKIAGVDFFCADTAARARKAAKAVIHCPLVRSIDLTVAKDKPVTINADISLTMSE